MQTATLWDVQLLVGMLGMIHGNDPFLVYPLAQAWKCPRQICLDLPEERPAPVLTLRFAKLDSLAFFPSSTLRPERVSGARPLRDSSNLKLTGSKTIRSSFGEGGMLVQQEMVLDVNGEPTPGLVVQAHLTDRDAPLSSTGSTTSLRQTDEIWIDARSRRFHSRIGDQPWSPPGGLLGTDTRNGRGLLLEIGDSTLRTWGGIAASRSQWLRQEIRGISGIQEGYSLARDGAGQSVVPASEKVWLDGLRLQRHVDYEFHSADGVIDFTPNRRILSSSRIVVEYQAADQDYERSLALGGVSLGGRGLRMQAWAMQESDDPASPLSYASDSASRQMLAQAGSDTSLLKTGNGRTIPLPSSQLRTGLTGEWSGWNTGALDLRWTRTDPNLASGLDTRPAGGALSIEDRLSHGRFLNRDGLGRIHLAAGFSGWQHGYVPLRPAQPDTQQTGGWLPPSSANGTHDRQSASLGWEALPAIGLWSNAQHFRQENWADLQSGSLKAGLDRDTSHQAILQQTIARLDQGDRYHRQTTRLNLAWVWSAWEPKLALQRGEREDPTQGGRNPTGWLEGTTGVTYRQSEWSTTAKLRSRKDESGFGKAHVTDSSNTLQATLLAEVQTSQWTGSLLLDWLKEESRSAPNQALLPNTHWLTELRSLWIPSPMGLRLEGHYRLSTSQWRASLPVYDTVPDGTGKFRFDSANAEVVPDEFGNLLLVGTRLDSLHPAQKSGNVLLSFSGTIIPKELNTELKGLLADVGEQFSIELEQVDSSQSRLFPAWQDQELGASILGRSSLSNRFWWERNKLRLELESERIFRNSIQNWSYTKDQDVVWSQKQTSTYSILREFSVSTESGVAKRRHNWSGMNDLYEKWWLEPSTRLGWHKWDGEVNLFWLEGAKSAGKSSIQAMSLFSQSLQLGWRPLLPLRLWTNLRHLEIQSATDLGSWLSEGYPPGTSWRSQTGIEWNIKESIQASADWIVRLLPDQPLEQKLSLQAQALF